MKLKIRVVKPSSTVLLILFLAVIAGALVAWRVFLAPRKPSPPAVTVTPTPESRLSPSPSPVQEENKGRGDSPEELIKSLKEKFPLIEFVPYQGEDFSVDYQAPLHLQVEIKTTEKTTEEAKEEVLDWIRAKGVNPSTHQIDWITP